MVLEKTLENPLDSVQFSSVSQSCLTLCDHMNCMQHPRPPCPSPTPGGYSDSCPSSQWCHPTISSSVIPFSPCLQPFPASASRSQPSLSSSSNVLHDYLKKCSFDYMDLCWQSNVCFLICCLGLQETWVGKILELGRSPGEWKGYPDQYSGLENSMDCIVHGFAKSWTRLRYFHFSGLS